jgi:23S rRNA (guanosine2251-2'-O)-methyltransferase
VEALQAGVPGSTLYLAYRTEADDRIRTAVKLATNAGINVLEVNRSELDRVTQGAVHQGLAMRVRPYAYAHPGDLVTLAQDAAQIPLIVALDSVTDPRNLGAIVRSAAAFGAHGVLIPGRRSAGVTAGAWKASAGTLARLPVAQAPNLTRALAGYQQAGLFVAGLATSGDTDIAEMDIATSPLVLVIGSEGKGLSRVVSEQCDLLVRIPIGDAESLNAGVAAGIALYEAARRRGH